MEEKVRRQNTIFKEIERIVSENFSERARERSPSNKKHVVEIKRLLGELEDTGFDVSLIDMTTDEALISSVSRFCK